MAITHPTSYEITSPADMALVKAAAAPLAAALANANAMWSLHAPPLRSCIWIDAGMDVSTRTYRVGVIPSQDGITYRHRHVVHCDTDAEDVTITVEWQASGGGWTSIYSAAHTPSSGLISASIAGLAIPAAADELRVTYSRPTLHFWPDSMLLTPEPAATTGRQASGFWPYDDALLTTPGAPINTELVNRPLRSTAAVLLDRLGCILSMSQDTASPLLTLDAATVGAGWRVLTDGYASVPYAPQTQDVEVSALATGATTTAGRLRVVVGGVAAEIDCDTTRRTTTITGCVVEDPGTERARVAVRIEGLAVAADTLDVLDVAAWAVPMPPLVAAATAETDPPASIFMLREVLQTVERRVMRPWPQPWHVVGGEMTRRFFASLAPASQRARLYFSRARTAYASSSAQSATTIETTTSGGVPSAAADVITVASQGAGTEGQPGFGAAPSLHVLQASSATYDLAAPGATTDRLLELAEGLAPTVEEVRVANAYGLALHVARARPESEYADI